jgi:hypothetical protein
LSYLLEVTPVFSGSKAFARFRISPDPLSLERDESWFAFAELRRGKCVMREVFGGTPKMARETRAIPGNVQVSDRRQQE